MVLIMSGTPIREMNNNISESDIQPDDQIIVIGEPNDTGQSRGRFIRVFQNPSCIAIRLAMITLTSIN